MRTLSLLVLALIWCGATALAQAPRFVIDDDEFADQVTHASARLLREHKLKSLGSLRGQVRTKGFGFKSVPLLRQPLGTPVLYERLRESTLAVGTYYKCPDCGGWHFNGSAGFVVREDGVICTCCHVVTAEDKDVKESYLVAANSAGRVSPVQAVLAADTEADTCLLKLGATGLAPLPLRPNVRPGERVYCLSHPGGYYFMFTEGLVSRLNSRREEALDEHGQTNGLLTRPILLLNVTAEFAPGSSGAPIVDAAGNVVGQVVSIAEGGDPGTGDDDTPASPSVPVRFCTATEEILRLTNPAPKPVLPIPKFDRNPKPEPRRARGERTRPRNDELRKPSRAGDE